MPDPIMTRRAKPSIDSISGRLFFFSSRRRHTSYIGDWSSDVCSSDLGEREEVGHLRDERRRAAALAEPEDRSEERRVGKECRCRGWPQHYKKDKPASPVVPVSVQERSAHQHRRDFQEWERKEVRDRRQ